MTFFLCLVSLLTALVYVVSRPSRGRELYDEETRERILTERQQREEWARREAAERAASPPRPAVALDIDKWERTRERIEEIRKAA